MNGNDEDQPVIKDENGEIIDLRKVDDITDFIVKIQQGYAESFQQYDIPYITFVLNPVTQYVFVRSEYDNSKDLDNLLGAIDNFLRDGGYKISKVK